MNLFSLKDVCALLVGKTSADLTTGSTDLFLVAANNARRNAELRHNFEYSRITALVDINGADGASLDNGANISSYLGDTYSFVKIKEIVAVMRRRPDGTYIPLDFARADIPIERDRTELEFSDNLFPYLRYPSDAQINARGSSSSIIQRGRSLYIYPVYIDQSPTTWRVLIEGYGWLNNYEDVGNVDDAPQDFFVEYGATYLQWAIVCELNMYFRQFVSRQEGNLSPPEKERDAAWHDLLIWDTYQIDSNTTRSR